jgi:hypothetical protein
VYLIEGPKVGLAEELQVELQPLKMDARKDLRMYKNADTLTGFFMLVFVQVLQ